MLVVIYRYAVSMRNARSLAGCFGSRRRECSGQEMTIYARRVCGRHFATTFLATLGGVLGGGGVGASILPMPGELRQPEVSSAACCGRRF